MELRTLKYFLAIAREENMTNAANLLHVSQSALSRQISDLEDELNTTLFIRQSRKMILTEDGMRLRKRAEEITSLVLRTELEFQSNDDDISGDIFIGAGETYIMKLISKTIRRIHETYPNIKFHLFSGVADDIAERIDHGLIDFGLLFEPVNKEKYDYIEIPVKERLGVIMRKDNPLATQKFIDADALKQMPLIYSSRQKMGQSFFHGWSDLSWNDLNTIGTYNLIYNASFLVEDGIANALCIDQLVSKENLTFIPLKPTIELPIVFVWKKFKVSSKASEIFLNEVRKDMLKLYEEKHIH